jgi:cell division protein FtsI/penicillin-binding protein 2
MDPATGDVLVAATTPTFDPNNLTPALMQNYTTGDDAKYEHRFVDRARFGYYPPGSTLKIAASVCALDNMPDALSFTVTSNHVADPIKWQAGGKWYIRRHVREDEADPSFGALTMGPALRVSSNIYFANLTAKMGSGPYRQTLVNRLGFSHVPSQEKFDEDLPDIGYGQGRMLATPLEMCRLAAAVANDGKICSPRIVTELTMPGENEERDLPDDPNDRPRVFKPQPPASAMSTTTAKTLQEMMRVVVTSGTARNIFTNMSFTVAGKTGSAQNHLYDGKAHSWFIGFAPYSAQESPRYAFACCVENCGYGRAAAAPVCREVLKKLK